MITEKERRVTFSFLLQYGTIALFCKYRGGSGKRHVEQLSGGSGNSAWGLRRNGYPAQFLPNAEIRIALQAAALKELVSGFRRRDKTHRYGGSL